jgi:hypothetical protein
MARSSRLEKRYFRTLEDIVHILVNEDGPAVNCGRRCGRDALVRPRSTSLLVRGYIDLQPYGSLTRNR